MENPILSGRFTSDGADKTINFRAEVDWIRVLNYTATAQDAADLASSFYWQRGMADGTGVVYTKLGAVANDPVSVDAMAAPNGFYPIDSSDTTPGALVAFAGAETISDANPPVVTIATTPNVGDIVRFSNLTSLAGNGQRQIAGMDFTVTAVTAGVNFTIGNINLANSTPSTVQAGTTTGYRVIPYDPIFYPRQRSVTWVTASSAGTVPAGRSRIYTSVTHGYIVGQKVNLQFPGGSSVWGNYAQMHNKVGTIVAVNTTRNGNEPNNAGVPNNFDVDIDTAGYGDWNVFGAGANQGYPANDKYPFTAATVVPVGENTAQAITSNTLISSDSVDNVSIIGFKLPGGAASPGGAANDVMYWWAGSSFDVNNE